MAVNLFGTAPSGWHDLPLARLAELTPGRAFKESATGTVPLLKPRHLVHGVLTEPEERLNENERRHSERYEIRAGDILLTRTGSIGRVARASADQERWVFGTGLIRVRPFAGVEPTYLAFYLSHPTTGAWLSAHATGSAIMHISAKALGSLSVRLPPPAVQRRICQTLQALDAKIVAHRLVCDTTAELRDALLPSFLTGRANPG